MLLTKILRIDLYKTFVRSRIIRTDRTSGFKCRCAHRFTHVRDQVRSSSCVRGPRRSVKRKCTQENDKFCRFCFGYKLVKPILLSGSVHTHARKQRKGFFLFSTGSYTLYERTSHQYLSAHTRNGRFIGTHAHTHTHLQAHTHKHT